MNPTLLTKALHKAASQQGARFLFKTTVNKVILENRKCVCVGVQVNQQCYLAKHVVVASGAWARSMDPENKIPVEPIRGQALHISCSREMQLKHIIFGKGIYLVPKDDGVTIGATHEHVGFKTGNTVEGIARLIHKAIELVPALGECDWSGVKTWSGLRPGSPDGIPFVGQDARFANLWWAVGHHSHGILLAPFSANQLTNAICANKEMTVNFPA